MRVEHKSLESLLSNARTNASQGTGDQARSATGSAPTGSTDIVNLSSAANLLALAKNLAPANKPAVDRQAKIAALTNQVRLGQYQPDLSEVGSAVVHGHVSYRG